MPTASQLLASKQTRLAILDHEAQILRSEIKLLSQIDGASLPSAPAGARGRRKGRRRAPKGALASAIKAALGAAKGPQQRRQIIAAVLAGGYPYSTDPKTVSLELNHLMKAGDVKAKGELWQRTYSLPKR